LWLLVVMLLLAFVAALVWLKRSAPQLPPPVVVPVPTVQPPPQPALPHKPRFEFYNTLPKQQVPVPAPVAPEVQPPAAVLQPPAQSTVTPVPTRPATRYRLQVGSYVRMADAERLRAELAFSGIETHLQSVTLDGGRIYHRVMAGPYTDQTTAEQARQQLQAQGYQRPLLLRIP
jgi:cell division protein FtsN